MPVLAALIGLLLGHAADLAFDRLYTGEPWAGPLHRCPACREPLRPLFLLPLAGLLWARGRCPSCRALLPWRALVLPLGSAALFALAYLASDELAPALLSGLFATVFLVLTLTDLERRLIPNRIVYPAILLAAALAWAWPDRSVLQVFAGGLVGLLLAAVLFLAGRGALGMGDVKMIVLMGLVVGLPGVLVGFALGAIAAGIVVAPLVLLRVLSRRDYIPYGPFIALGGTVALLWTEEIVDWYLP